MRGKLLCWVGGLGSGAFRPGWHVPPTICFERISSTFCCWFDWDSVSILYLGGIFADWPLRFCSISTCLLIPSPAYKQQAGSVGLLSSLPDWFNEKAGTGRWGGWTSKLFYCPGTFMFWDSWVLQDRRAGKRQTWRWDWGGVWRWRWAGGPGHGLPACLPPPLPLTFNFIKLQALSSL